MSDKIPKVPLKDWKKNELIELIESLEERVNLKEIEAEIDIAKTERQLNTEGNRSRDIVSGDGTLIAILAETSGRRMLWVQIFDRTNRPLTAFHISPHSMREIAVGTLDLVGLGEKGIALSTRWTIAT